MKLIPQDYAIRHTRRVAALALLFGIALGVGGYHHLTRPAAAVPPDPRMDLMCHWPSKPGEGMTVTVDETGKRRCWELGR